MGGYARGTAKKIKILKKEGVVVKKGKVDLDEFGVLVNKKPPTTECWGNRQT